MSLRVVIVGIVAVVATGVLLVSGLSGKTAIVPPSPLTSDVQTVQESTALPVRLVIPRLHVDAAVEYVGLLADGSMGAPKGPDTVGWYDRGPRPGDVGSAVIDGHFGWKNNIPAVFDTIDTLHKGDHLSVVDATGTTTTFVVHEIRIYTETASAEDIFHSTDGAAHLNLITCEGIWNAASKSYSGRLVVFADKK
jgi:sortase A